MSSLGPALPSRRTSRGVAAVVVAAAAVLAGTAGLLAQPTAERFSLTGDEVAIYNLAGRLQVVAGTGDAVVVEVTRGGADAVKLEIETGPHRGRQTLRVLYPERRIVYPQIGRGTSSTLEVDEDGFFGDSDGRRITVAGSGSGLEAHADLRVRMPAGQKLTIHWVVGEVTVINVEGELFVDHSAGSVNVDGIRGSLSLDTGSGTIQVSRARGDVTLDTGSGTLAVSDVQGGRLSLDTGSGTVTISNVKVDELAADTGSGAVTVRAADVDDIRLESGSGPVEVELVDDVESLVIDTGSGRITLRVPRGLGATFEIETSSGGIDIDVPYEATEVGRHEMRGRFGDGNGRIRIDSGSGGVRIISLESRGGASLETWRGALLALSIQ